MTRTTVLGMAPANGFLLILFVALPLLVGYLGSMATMPQIPGWYAGLIKPALNPPSWVFGPVWSALYVLMGIAAFRVYKKRARLPNVARKALGLYLLHLLVNLSWSLVFFGGQDIDAAVAVIALLWSMIVALTLLFLRIDKWAAILLVPYLLWVSFAAYLNITLAILN